MFRIRILQDEKYPSCSEEVGFIKYLLYGAPPMDALGIRLLWNLGFDRGVEYNRQLRSECSEIMPRFHLVYAHRLHALISYY